MKKNLSLVLALAGITLFLSNCASLTGFQDGRSLGKNNGEIMGSMNFAQSPDFDNWEDQGDSLDNVPNLFFPSVEFGGRYGVGEKVDITLRLNTNLNLGFGVKAQILGDRESKAALALGAEAGTFGLISGLWNFQVPVYFSVHPTERFAWYLTPKFVYQFSSYAGADTGLSYTGANTGLLFGKRNKFGLDLGYYRVGTEGESIELFQVGIGGRFALGRDEAPKSGK